MHETNEDLLRFKLADTDKVVRRCEKAKIQIDVRYSRCFGDRVSDQFRVFFNLDVSSLSTYVLFAFLIFYFVIANALNQTDEDSVGLSVRVTNGRVTGTTASADSGCAKQQEN